MNSILVLVEMVALVEIDSINSVASYQLNFYVKSYQLLGQAIEFFDLILLSAAEFRLFERKYDLKFAPTALGLGGFSVLAENLK